MDHFRLLDLPGEIRNKIYREALCHFDAPADDLEGLERQLAINAFPTGPAGITASTHSVNIALLLSNKRIHKEAYDVMVKTNQFVRVTTSGVAVSNILLSSRMPVVTLDRSATAAFRGYIMSIHLQGPLRPSRLEDANMTTDGMDPDDHDPTRSPFFDFMIVGRDLRRLCRALDEGDMYIHYGAGNFPQEGKLTIMLNPPVDSREPPVVETPLVDFFTDKTSSNLLAPFEEHLRGWSRAEICGPITPSLAESVRQTVAMQRWPDVQGTMVQFTSRKELANQAFRAGEVTKAYSIWSELSYDIERARRSPSGMYLITREPSFLTLVQEMYFLTNLNLGHLLTVRMQQMQQGTEDMTQAYHMASFCLREALRAMQDTQFLGTPWRPTVAQVAKLYYRRALCIRHYKDPTLAPQAFAEIDNAYQLTPRSVPIQAERDAILAWLRDVRGDVPLLRM